MSFGTTPVLNINAKPQLLVLASSMASIKDSTLSSCTWSLSDGIRSPEKGFAAKISLNSMVFFNSFHNIDETNNTLKIRYIHQPGTSDFIQITIPSGNYSLPNLLIALNSALTGYNTSFTVDAILNTVLLTLQPYDQLSTVLVKALLIIDEKTKPLLDILGFLVYGPGGIIYNQKDGENDVGVGLSFIYSNFVMTSDSLYKPGQFGASLAYFAAGSASNVGGINSLNIQMSGIRSGIRGGNQLSYSEQIASVPILLQYGQKICYYPPNPFKSVLSDLDLNEITIEIRNADTLKFVNFNNIGYIITLEIEWFEIETQLHSSMASSQTTRRLMPMFHHEENTHLIPHVGHELHMRESNKRYRESNVIYR